MVAFQMSGELERTRLRRGDSVTISETDPLKDRLTEGAISDVRNGALIVQVRGTFPEETKGFDAYMSTGSVYIITPSSEAD